MKISVILRLTHFLGITLLPFIVSGQLTIGTKAPSLSLEAIYPKTLDLSYFHAIQGKIIILDFWAIWCLPCVSAIPEMNALSNQYKDKNVVFIGITDDPKEQLENFLQKIQVDYVIGRDDDKMDFINYHVSGRPQIYVINPEGIIVYQGYRITASQIEEVIATNQIAVSPAKQQPNVFSYGGSSPGEDPLYNGVKIMLGLDRNNPTQLIEHFIIRPSLESSSEGSGYRKTRDGFIGITYHGGKLGNIFQFIHRLPSPIRITVNTFDTTKYDIIYWKKTGNIPDALYEIESSLLKGLSISFDSVISNQQVRLLRLAGPNENIRKENEIEEGTAKAYTAINTFASRLEELSEKFYHIDESLKNSVVLNREMDWNKMYNSSIAELEQFRVSQGISIDTEERMITLYQINKTN